MGFVYGLAVVGLAAVTEAVLWLVYAAQDGAHRRRSLRLGAVLVACAIAGLLNPITFHAYLAAILTQTSAVQQTFIAEWHSPSFHSLGEVGLELLLLLVVFAMAFRRPRLWDALLTVVGIYAALSAVRNAPLAAAALTPMVAWSFGAVWERSRWQEPLGSGSNAAPPTSSSSSPRRTDRRRGGRRHRGQHAERPDGEHRRQLPGRSGQLAGGPPDRRDPDVQRVRLGRLLIYRFYGMPTAGSSSTERRPSWATSCSRRSATSRTRSRTGRPSSTSTASTTSSSAPPRRSAWRSPWTPSGSRSTTTASR